jgi:hypothetical protein
MAVRILAFDIMIEGPKRVVTSTCHGQDPNQDPRAFLVKTKQNSLHQGKVYFLRSKTPEGAQLWIQTAVTARVSLFAHTRVFKHHQQLP